MPTKEVGCILVTSHLKQFLEDYPPSSEKQAFLDIYHMLSLLDKYLYDHPKQHTHCMSSDNEYVTLLKYAICFNIDLTTFPTLWAVLSILLATQDGKQEYVKHLQEEYNTYYEDKHRRYMLKLERKSVEIQNCMHDSVTQNFDRVSDLHDNGSPLYRDREMTSQLKLLLQRMPLMMMIETCERLESQNRASTQLQADWKAWQSCGQLHCLKIATMKLLMGKLCCAVGVGIELLVCVELLCLVVRTTVTLCVSSGELERKLWV